MKESISIFIEACDDGIRGPSDQQMAQLFSKFPDLIEDGRNGKELVLLGSLGDSPVVKSFLDEADRAGINIWEKSESRCGFGAKIRRCYDEADLDDCDYLHSCDAGSTFLGDVDYPLTCDPDGIPALAGKPRQKARMFGTPEPLHLSFLVARGEAKEKLELAGFKGLRLVPVKFNRARTLLPSDQLWAVWSDIIVPRVKNLFRRDGRYVEFSCNTLRDARNFRPAQGFLTLAELHYDRTEFEAIGDFDVGLMYEPIKIHGVETRNVIFSQRFRRFVIDELGVPFSGFPVRLDDDDIIPWEGPYPSAWAHLNRRPEWLERLQEEVSRSGRH